MMRWNPIRLSRSGLFPVSPDLFDTKNRLMLYRLPASRIRMAASRSSTIQSRVARTSFVVAWGFGRYAPEASAGMTRLLFRTKTPFAASHFDTIYHSPGRICPSVTEFIGIRSSARLGNSRPGLWVVNGISFGLFFLFPGPKHFLHHLGHHLGAVERLVGFLGLQHLPHHVPTGHPPQKL